MLDILNEDNSELFGLLFLGEINAFTVEFATARLSLLPTWSLGSRVTNTFGPFGLSFVWSFEAVVFKILYY